MQNFTPVSALVGGLLIGSAATLLLLFNGRIAGISGVVRGLIQRTPGDYSWRLLFLAGLVGGAGFYYALFGNAPVPRPEFPAWLLALGGLLVGFGTSLGSGCTSGHGVCGLGRLSARSLVATLIFVATGMVATYVVRHVFGVY